MMAQIPRLPHQIAGLPIGSNALSDRDFLAAIRSCSYPAASFHHADHLRLAWLLLERLPLCGAQQQLCELIRNFAKSLGKEARYHHTITIAWTCLLASHAETFFAEFLSLHGARASAALLEEFWTRALLMSDAARQGWVEPDIRPLPAARQRFR
jgi:CDP-diacylglycerol--glycerol-3-phosphate 3-phosphatidyltransferase